MRILRLFAPSLIGDHTLCYLHSNSSGESCINEVPIRVRFAFAGDDLSCDAAKDAMTIVLPAGSVIGDGDFLSVSGGETLLRWCSSTQGFNVTKPGFLSVSAPLDIWHSIRAAVLTVSDKGSRMERVDTAGPELERLITTIGGVVEDRKIVPDEMTAITETLTEWSDRGFNLILTTGGTGLSARDVTPEALLSIAERTVPGFGEMMRMRTLIHTPRAFLSRGLAVIRKKSLIIAFPGSQRGARQCFEAVEHGLRHAVDTLAGWDSECGGHTRHM